MRRLRRAAVAGSFYPSDPRALAHVVDAALDAAGEPPSDDAAPRALIVPHAGYVYSGPVAATAYARLRPHRAEIARVVLLGPAHFAPVDGVATSSADAFETPLGPIEVDDELRRRALALPFVRVDDRAHAREHSLEVQLPFLQRVLARCTILPLVTRDASPSEVAELLEQVGGGLETLVVVSSDLSHYLDYATAIRRDRRTADAIVARRPDAVASDDACGAAAVRGLLELAQRSQLTVRLLDLRNSSDTADTERDEVVGYGAFLVAP